MNLTLKIAHLPRFIGPIHGTITGNPPVTKRFPGSVTKETMEAMEAVASKVRHCNVMDVDAAYHAYRIHYGPPALSAFQASKQSS